MNEFYILLGSLGMTFIITKSFLFDSIKNIINPYLPAKIQYLINCPQCLGFWIGLMMGFIYLGVVVSPITGFATSFIGYIVSNAIDYIDSNIQHNTNQDMNQWNKL